MDKVPFHPVHLRHINIQKAQEHAINLFAHDEYTNMLMMGEGYTLIHKGEIILCAGIFPAADHMGKVWAFLSEDIGTGLIPATRLIHDFLIKSVYVRIETPVRRDFINGHRWCNLLGFVNETPDTGMKKYGFDGETYDLYAYFPEEHRDE